MPDTALLERTSIDSVTGKPEVAHIIASRNPDESAIDLVMESRVYGTPLEAICGETFVATKDAKKLPVCSRCKELYHSVHPDGDPSELKS